MEGGLRGSVWAFFWRNRLQAEALILWAVKWVESWSTGMAFCQYRWLSSELRALSGAGRVEWGTESWLQNHVWSLGFADRDWL